MVSAFGVISGVFACSLRRSNSVSIDLSSSHAKANIQNSMDAAEIPEYVFESLARSLLPVIQKYYESEDGKKVFAEWKAKKENTDCAST